MTGKDAGFRIRVERDLRDKFIEMCRAKDRPAAQVIRDFMRQYIEDNAAANDTQAAKKQKGHS
ncbi:plasmid-related protein [Parasphingorhabdus sp. JC815]|uniref:plasmid-related protein n=1 Tax=Parasphingorhabdus sp. JC815 TaxID=3232140 RepID=UPI00345776C0